MLSFFSSTEFLLWLVWSGLAVLTITLLVLMRTRWGRSRPLRKCVALSVLAHLLLFSYAATVKIVTAGRGRADETKVLIAEDTPQAEELDPLTREPADWERPAPATMPVPAAVPLERAAVDAVASPPLAATAGAIPEANQNDAGPNLNQSSAAISPAEVPTAELPAEPATSSAMSAARLTAPRPVAQAAPEAPQPQANAPEKPRLTPDPSIAATAPPELEPAKPLVDPGVIPQLTPESQVSLPEQLNTEPAMPADVANPLAVEALAGVERPSSPTLQSDPQLAIERGTAATPITATTPAAMEHVAGVIPELGPPPPVDLQPRQVTSHHVPEIYRLRVQPNREQLVATRGGNAATQTAVRQALRWLASNQSEDGRWDASQHGAGNERSVAGHNRDNAGAEADTGITGLALLAFLGDGHTHTQGPYRHVVQGAIDFLIRSQRSDGNLSGNAEMYAAMYCHGMAAFALAEAYGMTGDPLLEAPVRKAVAYTLAAQHRTQGGWRYRPGDAFGDTSQLGWQLMALKSAELAGIEVPNEARNGMVRFLKSVGHGKHGGLASYRAGELPNRVMTAEALFCRQLLGMTRDNPASNEAGDYIIQELPGEQINLYYWYYATLSTYQLQGKYWENWNQSLQQVLLTRQSTSDEQLGSWDPDCIWGGYGGRVYSTALATLCLEVYYRFLPLYVQKQPATSTIK